MDSAKVRLSIPEGLDPASITGSGDAVLRAVGMTRGQLSRLCLGEMVLVILVMLVLSLFGGLLLGWSFTGITRENLNAGLAVRFVIPWLDVARGFAMAAGLSLLMAALSAFGIRPSR